MSRDIQANMRSLLILHKLGRVKDPELRAKAETFIETDEVANWFFESLDGDQPEPTPAAQVFITAVTAQIRLQNLFDRLIHRATDGAAITDGDRTDLRTLDVTGSDIDHLHHPVTSAADTRSAIPKIMSKQNLFWLESGILRLKYPVAMIPHGLVWILYLGSSGRLTRQLVTLTFNPGVWRGRTPVNHLTSIPEPRAEDFYVVPVTESQLAEQEILEQVQAFVKKLADGPQRQAAHQWLEGLNTIEGESE